MPRAMVDVGTRSFKRVAQVVYTSGSAGGAAAVQPRTGRGVTEVWGNERGLPPPPPVKCPNCGQDTLTVSSTAASRRGDPVSKTRFVHRVNCTAECGLSDRQVHGAGLVWSGDRVPAASRRPLWDLLLGEDRCDVAHPTLPDTYCSLRVGHGGWHRRSAGVDGSCEMGLNDLQRPS